MSTGKNIGQGQTRRRFTAFFIRSVLAAAGIVAAYPLLRFTGFRIKPKPRHIVLNKTIPVGGSYTHLDFILFNGETGPLAVSRRCTHLGCRVLYREELGLIECPCHQSRFTATGKLINGPAKKNLASYPVRVLSDEKGTVTGFEVTL